MTSFLHFKQCFMKMKISKGVLKKMSFWLRHVGDMFDLILDSFAPEYFVNKINIIYF